MKLLPISSTGKIYVTDEGTSAPSGEADGYIGVTIIDGTARIYFAVGGAMYYTDGTTVGVVPIQAGMVMGCWLFWGTYA